MKYILAIDQGTTGSRAVVYDKAGWKIAGAYEEFRQIFPKPGWVEHDPDEIWRSVDRSIQKVLTRVSGAKIAAIGITNQRETTVVWDRESGRPIYNAIVWQCRRTAGRCDALKREKGLAAFVERRTGLALDAYFSATKIEWILKNVPGAWAKARRGELAFGTTDSWILWKLTNGASHATDFTNASRTMLFDIERRCWATSAARAKWAGFRRASRYAAWLEINRRPCSVRPVLIRGRSRIPTAPAPLSS
jgi:glycerol kinase